MHGVRFNRADALSWLIGLPRATKTEQPHETPLTVVEGELRQKGFAIVSQDDHFIDWSGDGLWWLVIGRKP